MKQKLMTFFNVLWNKITGAIAAVFGVAIASPLVLWDLAKKAVGAVQDFISNRWNAFCHASELAAP